MPSEAPSILQSALEREKSCEWSEAAEKYAELLAEVAPDSEEAVNASMRMGYCYEQAAYQALRAPEFERLLSCEGLSTEEVRLLHFRESGPAEHHPYLPA